MQSPPVCSLWHLMTWHMQVYTRAPDSGLQEFALHRLRHNPTWYCPWVWEGVVASALAEGMPNYIGHAVDADQSGKAAENTDSQHQTTGERSDVQQQQRANVVQSHQQAQLVLCRVGEHMVCLGVPLPQAWAFVAEQAIQHAKTQNNRWGECIFTVKSPMERHRSFLLRSLKTCPSQVPQQHVPTLGVLSHQEVPSLQTRRGHKKALWLNLHSCWCCNVVRHAI